MSLLLLCFLVVASVMDICSRKVKNVWIAYGLLSGLFMSFVDSGFWGNERCGLQMGSPGLMLSLIGILSPLPLLIFYRMRLIGAGDIKLLMVIGCFLGVQRVPDVFLIILFCAGIMAVVSMLANVRDILKQPDTIKGLKIPLAPAMTMGVAIYAGHLGFGM